MSSTTNQSQPLKVLLTAHPTLDTLDLCGPLEIFSHATFTSFPTLSNPSSSPIKVFHLTITASHPNITTNQGLTFTPHIPISTAYETLAEYDVLVIPGGGSPGVLEGKTEPLGIIKAFAELPKRKDGRNRYLLSVCTGSLFLAEVGVLDGLKAATHPRFYETLEEICASKGYTEVMRERFVVNKLDEKGLRVITSGGISCGLDAALWLVGEVAGKDSRERVMETVQYAWREGVVL
jgi:transcriptional regulator GlxA family with amidase domain